MRRLLMISTVFAAYACGQVENTVTWTDEATKLTWTAADSGAPVTFRQAVYYCQHLALAGHQDWALPTIDQLQRLFGGAANAGGFRISAPLTLTGWQWSSTLGKAHGEAWGLDFGDGGRASLVMGDSGLNRALCVRSEGTR